MHDLNVRKLLKKHDIESPMCWSDIPKGWLKLVDNLMADLIALGWNKKLDQVKSKFGGLRFYIRERSDEISARISKAEIESEKTCEHCGAPGISVNFGGYWVSTLCEACTQVEKALRDQS